MLHIVIFKFFIYLIFVYVVNFLHCCAWAFFNCGNGGPLSSCNAQVSHVAEHGL